MHFTIEQVMSFAHISARLNDRTTAKSCGERVTGLDQRRQDDCGELCGSNELNKSRDAQIPTLSIDISGLSTDIGKAELEDLRS